MNRFFPLKSILSRALWFIPFVLSATIIIMPLTVGMILYGTLIFMYGMITFKIKYVYDGLKLAIVFGPALYVTMFCRYIVYGEIDSKRIKNIRLLNKIKKAGKNATLMQK